MTLPVSACAQAAKKAVEAAGLDGITFTNLAAGGHRPTTRGYIICVRLPKDGACGGDGAQAVLVTAGSDAEQIQNLIKSKLKVPVTAARREIRSTGNTSASVSKGRLGRDIRRLNRMIG